MFLQCQLVTIKDCDHDSDKNKDEFKNLLEVVSWYSCKKDNNALIVQHLILFQKINQFDANFIERTRMYNFDTCT